MPWEEMSAVDGRVQLVARFLEGAETVSELSRRFGVSRKTAYKWIGRFSIEGAAGLEDRSRAPRSNCRSPSDRVVAAIVAARLEHPTWGPRKLRTWLLRRSPRLQLPAPSTIGAVLQRCGLAMSRKRRRRVPPYDRPFAACDGPNAVWCADFKGHFEMRNRVRCHPLTVSDAYSRYLFACKGLTRPTLDKSRKVFEQIFREYGLPAAIRTDNGLPFVGRGPGGLSRLSVWWVRLGIVPERIAPGRPDQNGRHERMHRTLKEATASPAKANLYRQQQAFDAFRTEFNHERPHEALGDATPATLYKPSGRRMPRRLPPITYPPDTLVKRVYPGGRIRWHGQLIFISNVLERQNIGLLQQEDDCQDVYFGPIYLGRLDERRPELGLLYSSASPQRRSLRGLRR